MDDVVIKVLEEPELKNPVLVEGLPGIGLVGKLAAEHMLDELKAKKFAELYSPYLPPQVTIRDDGTVGLVNMEFYYWASKSKSIIILVGDFQGITPESQYQLTEKTLDFVKKYGVKRIYTLGGLGTGNITKTPKVFGAATSKKLVAETEKHGVVFKGGGAIFGASGLLLGLGMQRGFEGVCLMGETHGQIVDAKSAEALLKVLMGILDVKVGMAALAKKVKETEKQMGQVSQMISSYEEAVEQQERFIAETPTYIR